MYGIIYIAKNKITKKVYIGQTIYPLEIRTKKHYTKKDDTYFHRALKKYKKETFRWRVLCECLSSKELNAKEKYFIEKYNSTDKKYGYNLKEGGKSGRPNKETLKKLRESHLGFKVSEETKKKIGDAHRGRKMSPERIEQMKISQKGRIVDPEWTRKAQETKKKNGVTFVGKNNPSYNHSIDIKEIKTLYLEKKMSLRQIEVFYKKNGILVIWQTIRRRLFDSGVKIRSVKESMIVLRRHHPEEYNKRMKESGKVRRGSKSYQYIKMTNGQLKLIVKMKKEGMTFTDIGKKIKCSPSTASRRFKEIKYKKAA